MATGESLAVVGSGYLMVLRGRRRLEAAGVPDSSYFSFVLAQHECCAVCNQ